MRIPRSLVTYLHLTSSHTARMIWEWLQSNSNTVITDELELALKRRSDWKEISK